MSLKLFGTLGAEKTMKEMPKSGKILFNSYPKVAHPERL
jgi:hypothetical protein